ncbi:MAG: thiamine phosphate synthase [Muribaculaceae bacterium]|nr:thiamine phosphate synthase [Muribaculaceae bacterium]MDE6135024.1 thiamine phosphate synthase [Muribaculaceae bacterium]
MLQLLIETNSRYSLAETARLAIEGGCGWLILGAASFQDPEGRDAAGDIAAFCRESAVMLSVENDVELARRLGAHGVFLRHGGESPVQTRLDLGAEAIIGAEIASPDAALTLERADIDYLAIPAAMSLPRAAGIITEVRKAGGELPFVYTGQSFAEGQVSAEDILQAGFAGICCGKELYDTADPVAAIASAIKCLNS